MKLSSEIKNSTKQCYKKISKAIFKASCKNKIKRRSLNNCERKMKHSRLETINLSCRVIIYTKLIRAKSSQEDKRKTLTKLSKKIKMIKWISKAISTSIRISWIIRWVWSNDQMKKSRMWMVNGNQCKWTRIDNSTKI